MKLESTRVIDIESSVDAHDIDRIYLDEAYYLAPAGKTGIQAFAVIRAAMAELDQVALGRLVLHQRERLCALEPRDSGIVDLMAALSQSLEGHGAIPRDKAECFAATRRRAAPERRRKKRGASSRAA